MKNISVIIPTYKRVNQTLQTIKCILNSEGIDTQFKLEVIVSDSSADDILKNEIQKEYGNTTVYVRPQFAGVSSGKNKGAKEAKGDILIFCDSDIEVEHNTILLTLQTLDMATVAAVTGKILWKGGDKDGQIDIPQEADREITIDNIRYTESIYSRYIATYKKLFWQTGGYDEQVFNMRGEGSDLSIRYWREGFPLAIDTSIVLRHIYDAPDSIALRISNPEKAIARDLLLLAYKYELLEGDCKNFAHTLNVDFSKLGEDSYYRILQGIGENLDFIIKAKSLIDEQKKTMKAPYPFKFLEVFSDKELFTKCIQDSSKILYSLKNS